MHKQTKKQKLDLFFGVLLQIYLCFPWMVIDGGRAGLHSYFVWAVKQKDTLRLYEQVFWNNLDELPGEAEMIAAWFLIAVIILLGVQISEAVHLVLSLKGKPFPFLQPVGWIITCIVTVMLVQFGMMQISIQDSKMAFGVPLSICIYFMGFLILDGMWFIGGKAVEQWDEASRQAHESYERRKAYKKERKRRLAFPGKYSYLYYRVMWKAFRHRWKDFSFLFFSIFFSTFFLFIGISMQSVFADSYGEDQALLGLGLVEIMRDFLMVLLLISLLLILGVLVFYRRRRLADESILRILGIRNHSCMAIWLVEVIGGYIAAIVSGLFFGRMGLEVLCRMLKKGFSDFGQMGTPEWKDYFWTGIAVAVIELFAFGFSHDIEAERQSADGRAALARSEKIPGNYRFWGAAAGIGICLYSIYRYSQRRSAESMIVLCIFFAGMLMVSWFGGSIYLHIQRRTAETYLTQLPRQHKLRHRYKTTIRYLVLLTVIHISVFYFFSMKLVSNQISERPEDIFPYDYVLLANSQDHVFLEELKCTCKAEVLTFPMVRATTVDNTEMPDPPNGIIYQQGQNIGISESVYRELKKLAGEIPDTNLGLDDEGHNIYIVYQQDQGCDAKPIDWYMMTKDPYLHIGQPLFAYNTYEYRNYYPQRHISGEERSSLIGCFRQGKYENLIVFSDAYFEQIKDSWKYTDMNTGEELSDEEAVPEVTVHEWPTTLALVQIPEQYQEQADERIQSFRKAHAYDESLDPLVESVYIKSEAVIRRQMEHILEIVMNGFVLGMLTLAGLFILRMKVNMELPEMQTRYQFLECFGMYQKERIQIMKKEISLFVWIPLGTGMIIALAFTGIVFKLRDFQIEDILYYFIVCGGIWILYSVIQIWNLKRLQKLVIRKIEGKVGAENDNK